MFQARVDGPGGLGSAALSFSRWAALWARIQRTSSGGFRDSGAAVRCGELGHAGRAVEVTSSQACLQACGRMPFGTGAPAGDVNMLKLVRYVHQLPALESHVGAYVGAGSLACLATQGV